MNKITITMGKTINLGNFQSARVDVILESTTSDTTFEKDYQQLSCEVKAHLANEIQAIEKAPRNWPDLEPELDEKATKASMDAVNKRRTRTAT